MPISPLPRLSRVLALVCIFLSLGSSSWAQPEPSAATAEELASVEELHKYRAAYQDLQTTLILLRDLSRDSEDPQLREVHARITSALRRAASRLQAPERGASDAEEGAFAELLLRIENTIGARARIAAVRQAAGGSRFQVAQVQALMNAANFDSAKIEIARLLHDCVLDPQNWAQVYRSLDFQSSRKTLKRRLGQGLSQCPGTPKVPKKGNTAPN